MKDDIQLIDLDNTNTIPFFDLGKDENTTEEVVDVSVSVQETGAEGIEERQESDSEETLGEVSDAVSDDALSTEDDSDNLVELYEEEEIPVSEDIDFEDVSLEQDGEADQATEAKTEEAANSNDEKLVGEPGSITATMINLDDYPDQADIAEILSEKQKDSSTKRKFKEKITTVESWHMLAISMAIMIASLVFLVIGKLIADKNLLRQREQLQVLGQQFLELEGIGEDGLLAMETKAEILTIEKEESSVPEDEVVSEPVDDTLQVAFVSLEQDLKIKFTSLATGRLVKDIPFCVTIKGASGTYTLMDDDTDGIIYKQGLKAGEYQVSISEVDSHSFLDIPSSVTIKDKITYVQVDVAQEVKTENEINVAVEDTAVNAVVVEEPVAEDTVELVESTQTEESTDSYIKLEKAEISEPFYVAITTDKHFATEGEPESSAERGSGQETGEDSKTENASDKNPDSSQEETTSGNEAEKEPQKEPEKDEKTPDDNPPEEKTEKPSENDAESDSPEKEEKTEETNAKCVQSVSLEKADCKIKTEEEYSIKPTALLEDGTKLTDTKQFTYKSSAQDIAEVDSTGKVKGKKAGTAEITVSYKDEKGNEKSAVCKVTVQKDPSKDKETKLFDKRGRQVYVKEGGQYREAFYADYYSQTEFYVKESDGGKYTGWQNINGNIYYFTKDGIPVVGDQIIGGISYHFNNDGILTVENNGIIGIDVSKWNGTIDWNAVAASGVKFAIIRCGYRGSTGGSLIMDPTFATNIQGAKAAGLKVGLYFFTQAVTEVEAVEEASLAISLASIYGISYPIFIDTEESGGRGDKISKAERTAVVKAFCETVKNAGYIPGVYASKWWYYDNVDFSQLSGYRIWLAQYCSQPDFTGHYDLWQFTANGACPGMKGKVDYNISYMGY